MEGLITSNSSAALYMLLIALILLIYNYLTTKQMMSLLTDIKSQLTLIAAYYSQTNSLVKSSLNI